MKVNLLHFSLVFFFQNDNHFIGITVYNNIGITDKEELGNERTDKIGRIGHDGHLAAQGRSLRSADKK